LKNYIHHILISLFTNFFALLIRNTVIGSTGHFFLFFDERSPFFFLTPSIEQIFPFSDFAKYDEILVQAFVLM